MKKPAAKKAKRIVRTKPDASMSFKSLVDAIQHVHTESAAVVNRTVNTTLTLRNWVIGAYIHHYELHGQDRAKYGEGLIDALAKSLESTEVTNAGRRQLYLYVTFYRTYPQIVQSVTAQSFFALSRVENSPFAIVRSLSAQSTNSIVRTVTEQSGKDENLRLVTGKSEKNQKVRTLSAQSAETVAGDSIGHWLAEIQKPVASKFTTDGQLLIERLSFSHFELLVSIDQPLKRAFYEIECIRGNWSVRDLKRQIGSLYFERSGLSKDKEKLSKMVNEGIEAAEPKLAIRDPYVFEFLGLRAKDAVAESDLEAALIEHMREFLLELGHGFCLEAQQKSIVIGKTRGFVDLVFYHRILKCHVLAELKIEPFTHEHLGQLNTYVTWYREHMMSPGDNPPIGLLLCTDKDHALVRYATASVNNKLFVSKYAVELPSQKELETFLHAKHLEMLGNTKK